MTNERAMGRIDSWRLLARSAVLALILLFSGAAFALDVPPLTGRIVDLADLLDASQEAVLDGELSAHEAKSSDQVVVLTIPALSSASSFAQSAPGSKESEAATEGRGIGGE